MQSSFSVGDIVWHRIMGTEKVVVGVKGDRYLCAYRRDIRENGCLLGEARVAIHRRESLRKVGRLETVLPVSLTDLYEEEYKEIFRIYKKNLFREEIIPNGLFFLAMILVVLALLAGVEGVRTRIEATFFKKVDEKKTELMQGVIKLHEQKLNETRRLR